MHSNVSSLTLGQKQTYRAMDFNRRPGKTLIHTSTVIWSPEYALLKKTMSYQTIVLRKWRATCQGMKIDSYLLPCTKFNSKWITDLIRRLETFRGKYRKNTSKHPENLSAKDSNQPGNSCDIWQMKLHELKKVSYIIGNTDWRHGPHNGRKSLTFLHKSISKNSKN